MDNSGMDRWVGQMLDGRYKITEVIGRGGMAVVYKAHDHLLNRDVAIKFLRDDMAADKEFRLHFKKEAQAVAKLSHANIVSIYDVSRVPELDYIVMELIDGVTLKQFMKTKGALSSRESAHFAQQIAKALSHAHAKGIVHRDIKPQNIMIGLDGRVKVADFGIAYLESALGENKDLAVGSVHYISPEQARGLPADARSDIYSLGVVLYEMLSGQLPFQGEDPDEVTVQHLNKSPTPLRELDAGIPRALEAIVMKAMAQDINKRYQSADEMLRDLEKYLATHADTKPGAGKKDKLRDLDADSPLPVSRSGELSLESYDRRRRRSAKVSILTGFLLVLTAAVAVFVFLWNYWLRDIFSDPVKISIPNFVGSDYHTIIQNEELLKIYNFKVEYNPSAETPEDLIISQTPESGRNRTLDSRGIDVELTVSSGIQMLKVPNVVNMRYTDAVETLERSGFQADASNFVLDQNVTADFVIASNPAADESIPAGSTVALTISLGPRIVTVEMPDLVGKTRSEAEQILDSLNLSLGSATYTQSTRAAGIVTWQSVEAGSTVNEYTRVFLQISSGPYGNQTTAGQETPAVTETVAPTRTPIVTDTAPTASPSASPEGTPEPGTVAAQETQSVDALTPVAPEIDRPGIGGQG